MRQQFNPENYVAWLQYYSDQVNQTGYGLAGFKGTPYQRGGGLGSFFRALFRMAVPVIKSAASHVGKQALATGAHIVDDVAQGRPIMESIEKRGRSAVSSLAHKAGDKIMQKGTGLGARPKGIKVGENDIFSKRKRKPQKHVSY